VQLSSLCVCVKLSRCQSEASSLQKDYDRLLDQVTGSLTPDDVLQATRNDRDQLSHRSLAAVVVVVRLVSSIMG